MRSGIWHFDLDTRNLYHHRSFGQHNDTDANVKDFGQGNLFRVGAIKNVRSLVAGANKPDVIVGASHYASYTGATRNSIYEGLQNRGTASITARGYFISPRIPSIAVQDEYKKLWLIFRKFISTDNRIVVKYRITDPT